MWLMQLMKNLHQLVFVTITLWQLVRNTLVREKMLQGEIQMEYVKTEDQVADLFTKGIN